MMRAGQTLLLATCIAALATSTEAKPSAHNLTLHVRLIDNLLFTSAVIDGVKANAVIDSGTGGIVVDTAFAKRIALHAGRSLGNAEGAGAEPAPLYAARLRSIRLGKLEVGPTNAFLLDTAPFSTSSGARVDAILGRQIFDHHVVTADYHNSTVVISHAGYAPHPCANPLHFELVHGVPVVLARISFREGAAPSLYRLGVDLGTRHHSIFLGRAFLSSPSGRALMASSSPTRVAVGTGGPAMGWTSTAARLQLGSMSYMHIDYAATQQLDKANSLAFDGTLGVPLWESGSITFDYGTKQICLRP